VADHEPEEGELMSVEARRHFRRFAVTAGVLAVVATLTTGVLPAAAQLSEAGEASQFLSSALVWNWYASPSGANTGCRPTSAHPFPVVLTEGTFANMYNSFGAIAPDLVNNGYCVYSFNYGQTIHPSMADAMGNIPTSARELSRFVNQVLSETGARKVDIVGWSQGGMMPRYYVSDLGGASKVNMLVGFAPSNYGTTVDGYTTLISDLGLLGVSSALLSVKCEACVQQLQGSSFLDNLNKKPTVSNVKYVVIETEDDEVVTPYTNAFLPAGSNVQNILLQNQCPQDSSDHLSIPYDSNALADMINALGADLANFVPNCQSVGPIVGNV
jgi:triacylglycerol esterase/lipase EstA (alpha/beta hydrolase family)